MQQVVLVLIDALRVDFVIPRDELLKAGVEITMERELPRIKYLETLISQNEAHVFVASASPPTVTLPRIKVERRWMKYKSKLSHSFHLLLTLIGPNHGDYPRLCRCGTQFRI